MFLMRFFNEFFFWETKKYFKDAPKIGTTTYNMKVCLSLFNFDIFNIARFH
jgi:hypothetical protein